MLLAINKTIGGENVNKKFIAILLILGLLTVGICAVSAEDVADDSAAGEEGSYSDADTPLIATSPDDSTEDTSDDSAEDAYDDEAYLDEEYPQEDEDATTDESTTSPLLPDEGYEGILTELYNLDEYKFETILSSLYQLNDPVFDELVNAFDNDADSEIILQMLKDMDMEHFVTFIRICNDVIGSSSNNYLIPTQSNPVKTTTTASNIKSDVTGNGTSTSTNSGTTPSSTKNPVYKQAKNVYPAYNYGEYISDYDIYHYYLDLYLNGQITFNELKIYLELEGINTDDLILNEDGSVEFFGETSPVPTASKDTEDDTVPVDEDADDDTIPADDEDTADDTADASDDVDIADNTDSSNAEDDTGDSYEDNGGDESVSEDI